MSSNVQVQGDACTARDRDNPIMFDGSGSTLQTWQETLSASSGNLAGEDEAVDDEESRSSHPFASESSEKKSGVRLNHNKESPEMDVRVGTFRHNGQTKEYAIVPSALITDDRALNELMEHWGLSEPNFIVEVNASTEAMGKIIAEEDTLYMLQNMFLTNNEKPSMEETESEKETKKEWLETLKGNKMPLNPPHPEEEVTNTSSNEMGHTSEADYLPMINKHIQRKSALALKSIVSAADMNDGWILCTGKPTANERLLESAIDRTGSKRLNILVVDNLERYSTCKEGEEIWAKMKKKSRKLCTLEDVGEGNRRNSSIIGLTSKQAASEHMSYTGGAQRITTISWPPSRSSDSAVWDIDADADLSKVKWEATWPWERGTHYIFSENYANFEAQKLGPHGYVCLHGETEVVDVKSTGYIIREALSTIRPCLLFNNTGNETQIYAQLITRIGWEDAKKRCEDNEESPSTMYQATQKQVSNLWKCCMCPSFLCFGSKNEGRRSSDLPMVTRDLKDPEKSYYDSLQIDLRKKAWHLQKHAVKGCSDAAEMLTIDHVFMIVDLYCRNPSLFRSVVVPVDPLNDEPDDIVKQLTWSFARADLERKEVGAGDADKKAVERAWRLHHQLDVTKGRKNSMRVLLYFSYIVAGILTTVVSVLWAIILPFKTGHPDTDSEKAIRWTSFALAAVVSLCAGLLNLMKFDSQLARIQTAQAKIIYELFQFRMRVGKYSLSARERSLDEERKNKACQGKHRKTSDDSLHEQTREDEIANKSTAMHEARARFSKALSDVFQELSSLDLYYDKLAQGVLTMTDRQLLEKYVSDTLHIKKDPKMSDETIVSEHLITEDYYKLRVYPLLKRLEKEEDVVRLRTRSLQVCSMICSSAAMVLGAAGEVMYIPIIVALATGLFQLIKVMDYERRFEIISSAARETGALDAYWESLSPMDRCMRSTRVYLVRTCEQLALQFETTSVIQVDKAELGMDENNESLIPMAKSPQTVRNAAA